jgi:hypothetical protein
MALTKVQAGLIESTITSGTAVTASGTSIDFTGIPAGVKRITVMFSGVSTNGSSLIRFQLGDSGGIETTGYVGVCGQIGGAAASAASTSGFDSFGDNGASVLRYGTLVFTLIGSNTWTLSGSYNIVAAFQYLFTGSKVLSDTLDRVRITTVNGTDVFDAGTINIMWES